jgi:magnesium transporter
LFVGITLALCFYLVAIWHWGGGDIVVAVALAIFSACTTANGVALALPWLLYRLDIDPAFGSGPLATVIQDLLSILIYLAIATAIVP